MNSSDIINFVIGLEGGYVDNPADPGGATNMGITQAYLDANRVSDQTLPVSVKDLTISQVEGLYQKNEWTQISGDQLPPPLALLLFDTAVNEGADRAVKTLQQALGITIDGNLGPVTLAAAQKAPASIYVKFAAWRGVFYATLDVKEGQFEYQWMNRLITVYTKAIQ